MVLESIVVAALAGVLVQPTPGMAPPSPAPSSENPLLTLAGAGLAALGDVFHPVPILGPILGPMVTGTTEGALCDAKGVPLFGTFASAAVDKFAKDQKQESACSAPAEHASASNPPRDTGTDHAAAPDTATKPTRATGTSTSTSTSTGTGTSTGTQAVTFPKGPFQIRQGSGADASCVIAGMPGAGITPATTGRCDASAAWSYQSDSGELRPASDDATCLVAQTRNLQMVTIDSCATAASWTKHWYLSGTRRLFIKDSDEHDSWRFLGAPGALVVGGVDEPDIPAVPVWTFPAP
jgi:hypothetical protein